jgi:hypothetical protein
VTVPEERGIGVEETNAVCAQAQTVCPNKTAVHSAYISDGAVDSQQGDIIEPGSKRQA